MSRRLIPHDERASQANSVNHLLAQVEKQSVILQLIGFSSSRSDNVMRRARFFLHGGL